MCQTFTSDQQNFRKLVFLWLHVLLLVHQTSTNRCRVDFLHTGDQRLNALWLENAISKSVSPAGGSCWWGAGGFPFGLRQRRPLALSWNWAFLKRDETTERHVVPCVTRHQVHFPWKSFSCCWNIDSTRSDVRWFPRLRPFLSSLLFISFQSFRTNSGFFFSPAAAKCNSLSDFQSRAKKLYYFYVFCSHLGPQNQGAKVTWVSRSWGKGGGAQHQVNRSGRLLEVGIASLGSNTSHFYDFPKGEIIAAREVLATMLASIC